MNNLHPEKNKFHIGNGSDGKHYWLTPPEVMAPLQMEFAFDFDPCPCPLPEGFDGLTCEWGSSNYVNPPFGSIVHQGRKKGMTAWVRKALAEHAKGKRVVMVYPIDKWILMLLKAGAEVRNLGDIKWLATEDGSAGKGTGRHIACFVLNPSNPTGLRAGHLVDGTQHPVVLPKDLNVPSENRQASRQFRGTGTASASSKGNSPNAHFLKTHKEE